MTANNELKEIAEKYLDEMIAADSNGDYAAFTQRFEPENLMDFDPEKFQGDIDEMREDLGEYNSRVYLGSLNGHDKSAPNCQRFVWKGIYEKNETLIVVGVYEKEGVCYVNENMCY